MCDLAVESQFARAMKSNIKQYVASALWPHHNIIAKAVLGL
jgi:hypothetical protein